MRESLHAILVRCYDHWFIPYEPGTADRQCVYTNAKRAEETAEELRTKETLGKRHYAEVVITRM